MARNQVRIIGGKWKGRKLGFPAIENLRPTLGRVRETLFSWLVTDIADALCLDLFAGSGALGFEALSRGAREVTFVESNRRAAASLSSNAARLLGTDEERLAARVRPVSAWQFLRTPPASRWDVIFLDPPFGSGYLPRALAAIAERNILDEHGFAYFEMQSGEAFDPCGWRVVKSSQAGDSQFGLLAREF